MTTSVLVTGASGHVGGELVASLVAAGRPVRAMTRRPAELVVPPGVEVVAGDADDAASLDAAFAGVGSAFVMSAQVIGSAPVPTQAPALVDAAVRAGVGRVVLLSSYDGGAEADPIGLWTRRIEDAVRASGLTATILRPGRFMSNGLVWAPQIRRADEVVVPFAQRPAASIDPADVAAIAARALTAPGPDEGVVTAHRLSGPQALRPVDELAAIAAVVGRPLRAVEPPLDQVRAWMVSGGMSSEVVDAVLRRTCDGDEGTEVLPTVETLLGRPARRIDEWAAAHRDAFTG